MRLISLNAWGGHIIAPLMAFLQAERPDVLCLQEVTRAVDPSPERLVFKGHGWDLPQHADLLAAVSGLLPDHRAMFCPAMQGELFDAEGRAYRSQFGLASFVHRRIAVERQVEAFVHGAYRADGWGRPPVPRNLHGMRLRDPASGRAFAVAQFHGLRDLAGKHDTPARQAQATRVRDLLSEVCREGEAAVLCGDFNLLPDSESFGIWREAGLRDLVTGNGFADTRTSLYEKDQRFADYLLVSDAVKVLRFDVPAEPEVSDHRPLVLEFDIGA